jgi:hypothetical protein
LSKKSKRLGFIGAGFSVPLFFEVLESDAWNALTPLQHDVLIDMFRVYLLQSKFDTVFMDRGLAFTWAHCPFPISEESHSEAIKQIVRVGFFDRAPQYDDGRPGSPRMFTISRRWREYRLTEMEKSKRDLHFQAKSERLRGKRARRRQFLATLPDRKKCTPDIPDEKTHAEHDDTMDADPRQS